MRQVGAAVCRAQASHCGGSSCGAQALGVQAAAQASHCGGSSCGARAQASHCGGSSCGARALGLQAAVVAALGSAAVARGPSAPQPVGSSQTREHTHVPCIGRWILNRWDQQGSPPKNVFNFDWLCVTSYYIFSFKVSHLASSLKTSRGEDVGHPRTPALALASSHHVLRLGL